MSKFIHINSEQTQQMLATESNLILLDIRDPQSYQEAHISNAKNINSTNIEEFCNSTNKSNPIIVYCYHGISSQRAAEYLKAEGFQNVYSLEGGFEGWKIKYA